MFLEELYADLEAIAKHRGPLDVDAVRRSTTILARPRYAEAANPAGLLVSDLELVIAAIPNYPLPAKAADVPWASQKFRDHARRYFSIDGAGQTFTHRRTFGRKDPGGAAAPWMTRGVLYRVAAGLLELWADEGRAAVELSATAASCRIDSVGVLRHFAASGVARARDTANYTLRVVTSGPHLLILPFPARSTSLIELVAEQPCEIPKPDVVAVDAVLASCAAVAFGTCSPGERVHIRAQHRSREDLARQGYRVNQAVGTLSLAVHLPNNENGHTWEVQRTSVDQQARETIAEPSEGYWTCSDPQPGYYKLAGTPVGKRERRRDVLR